ncbi:signal transduction histidine kinase [Nitrobacteraceae bacterium AZCC 1564]
MAGEVLQQAFDSNFTTKPVGQGSGLGFGQVQRFVQESGGALKSSPRSASEQRRECRRVYQDRLTVMADLSNLIATF